MADQFDLTNILFLDIETVSRTADFEDLDERWQELWSLKQAGLTKKSIDEMDIEELQEGWRGKAAIFAEFGKIICISVGKIARAADGELSIRIKSFAHDNESVLLDDFAQMLEKSFSNPDRHALCGHNIKEFDVPYICRRMSAGLMPLPRLIDISGKKPWETKHLIDTMEMWKFGDGKQFTSLKLLAAVFDFPSPKDDIDGSQVGRVYWDDRELDRIAAYCEKDVLATAQLFLRMKRQPLLKKDAITFVGR